MILASTGRMPLVVTPVPTHITPCSDVSRTLLLPVKPLLFRKTGKWPEHL